MGSSNHLQKISRDLMNIHVYFGHYFLIDVRSGDEKEDRRLVFLKLAANADQDPMIGVVALIKSVTSDCYSNL